MKFLFTRKAVGEIADGFASCHLDEHLESHHKEEEPEKPATYTTRSFAERWGVGLDDADLIRQWATGFPSSGTNVPNNLGFLSIFSGFGWGGTSPQKELEYLQSRVHNWEAHRAFLGEDIHTVLRNAKKAKADSERSNG